MEDSLSSVGRRNGAEYSGGRHHEGGGRWQMGGFQSFKWVSIIYAPKKKKIMREEGMEPSMMVVGTREGGGRWMQVAGFQFSDGFR